MRAISDLNWRGLQIGIGELRAGKNTMSSGKFSLYIRFRCEPSKLDEILKRRAEILVLGKIGAFEIHIQTRNAVGALSRNTRARRSQPFVIAGTL
jgi:hypothetical protein